jgi:type IV secretory pathway TrbD component
MLDVAMAKITIGTERALERPLFISQKDREIASVINGDPDRISEPK